MSDLEQPGSAIERYIPTGELADRQADELALVGLSPEFPQRVTELNDALIEHGHSRTFNGFRFTLHPDVHRPKVDVDAHYYSPYQVVIEATKAGGASLSIAPKAWEYGSHLAFTRLGHLKDFFEDYPTDEPIVLTSIRSRQSHDEPQPGPITVPLVEINSPNDLRDRGINPASGQLQLGFESQRYQSSGFSMNLGWHMRRDVPDLLAIESIKAHDRAPAIESVIGSIAVLLSRDPYELIEY